MDFRLWDQCGIYSSSRHSHEKKRKKRKKEEEVWQYKTAGKQILRVCNNFLQHLTHFYDELEMN